MMRIFASIATLALLTSCQSGEQSSAKAAVRAANAEYDRALVDGDAVALDRFYTDDFKRSGNDGQVHGKQDQIAFISSEIDLLEARSDEVAVTMLGPDAALVTGRISGRYRYQGKVDDFTERYTSVWLRQDGRWRVRHEHASLVPKPESRPIS